LAASPPSSMKDVAQIYGKLLTEADQAWRAASKDPAVKALPDPDQEALRQVLYGPESPASVPPGPVQDVEWVFDETTRVELNKLQGDIERWNINAAGAVDQAVILQDRSVQRNPRVFKR